jgi:hypothetical protein
LEHDNKPDKTGDMVKKLSILTDVAQRKKSREGR